MGLADHDEMASLNRLINEMHLTDSMWGTITRGGLGLMLNLRTPTPFYGTINADDTKMDIGAFRGVDGYGYRDTVTVCSSQLHKSASETTGAIGADSFVYYDVEVPSAAGDAITAVLTVSTAYPVTDADNIKPVLGKAFVTAGVISRWVQYQFGDIFIPSQSCS